MQKKIIIMITVTMILLIIGLYLFYPTERTRDPSFIGVWYVDEDDIPMQLLTTYPDYETVWFQFEEDGDLLIWEGDDDWSETYEYTVLSSTTVRIDSAGGEGEEVIVFTYEFSDGNYKLTLFNDDFEEEGFGLNYYGPVGSV